MVVEMRRKIFEMALSPVLIAHTSLSIFFFNPSRRHGTPPPPPSLSEVLNSIKLRRRRRQQFVVKKRISSLETALDIFGTLQNSRRRSPSKEEAKKKVCAFFYLGSKREAIIREKGRTDRPFRTSLEFANIIKVANLGCLAYIARVLFYWPPVINILQPSHIQKGGFASPYFLGRNAR